MPVPCSAPAFPYAPTTAIALLRKCISIGISSEPVSSAITARSVPIINVGSGTMNNLLTHMSFTNGTSSSHVSVNSAKDLLDMEGYSQGYATMPASADAYMYQFTIAGMSPMKHSPKS